MSDEAKALIFYAIILAINPYNRTADDMAREWARIIIGAGC